MGVGPYMPKPNNGIIKKIYEKCMCLFLGQKVLSLS